MQIGRFCCGVNWTQDQRERMKAWFSYVGTIPDDPGDFTFADHPILDIRHKTVSDSSDIEFGGKWKVRQKLKLV